LGDGLSFGDICPNLRLQVLPAHAALSIEQISSKIHRPVIKNIKREQPLTSMYNRRGLVFWRPSQISSKIHRPYFRKGTKSH